MLLASVSLQIGIGLELTKYGSINSRIVNMHEIVDVFETFHPLRIVLSTVAGTVAGSLVVSTNGFTNASFKASC